jgi:hypothetical protein
MQFATIVRMLLSRLQSTESASSLSLSLSLSLSRCVCPSSLSLCLYVRVCPSLSLCSPHQLNNTTHNSSPHNIQVLPQSSKYMGSQGSSESYATTNNTTKCEKNKHKTRSKTLPTRAQAFLQRPLRETINKKARTETGRQTSKQKAPGLQNV